MDLYPVLPVHGRQPGRRAVWRHCLRRRREHVRHDRRANRGRNADGVGDHSVKTVVRCPLSERVCSSLVPGAWCLVPQVCPSFGLTWVPISESSPTLTSEGGT